MTFQPGQWTSPGGPSAWPPPPRPALPPWDSDTTDPQTGAPLPVHKTPNFVGGPPHPRVRREQFCGLMIDGLPSIPGGASDPRLFLSWFLDRYDESLWQKIADAMAATGATHWTLSWPDSRAFGTSPERFEYMARWLTARGFYVCVKWLSKVYDPRNPDDAYLDANVFPVLDRLVAAGAIACGTPAWEMNAFVDPEAMDRICGAFARRAPSVLWYLHFLSGYAAWQKNTGDSPGAFWNRRKAEGYVGLEYQAVPVTGRDADGEWSAGMLQARINDCLVRFVDGGMWQIVGGLDFVIWELSAQPRFNGQYDEPHGILRGLEGVCAQGPMRLSGYGNDAAQHSGEVLQ